MYAETKFEKGKIQTHSIHVPKFFSKPNIGVFSVYPPPSSELFLAAVVVVAATSVFTEYVFCESMDSAHNSQPSSIFQEPDCLLKLVKVNKELFAITLLNRNLNHTAQLSISYRGNDNFVSRAGRYNGKDSRTENIKSSFHEYMKPYLRRQFRPFPASFLFCAIFFRIWKQNLLLKWAIPDVFLPDVCQLRSN